MDEFGLSNGAYSITDEGLYLSDDITRTDGDIAGWVTAGRFNGLTDITKQGSADPAFKQNCIKLLHMYPNTHGIGGEITAQMTSDENVIFQDLFNNISTYNSIHIPEFITGELDIYDDASWENYCDEINAFQPEQYTDILNAIMGF